MVTKFEPIPAKTLASSAQVDVSVVICAYTADRWNDLAEAIDSIRSQSVRARETVVVIDHNDGLRRRVQLLAPDLVVVENTEARGLSGARNCGIRAAKGSIIAFLDDDAVAAPDWLEHLVTSYDNSRILGVGGAIEPMWTADRPPWFPAEFDWVVGCTYRGMPETSAVVRNLIGANMSFRREVFEVVGGFRAGIGRVGALPVGCEETELCIRSLRHWPQRVWRYEPRALVLHKVPAHRGRWGYFRSRCYAEGRSKALVSTLVGANEGLSSERAYTLRTLPFGVARGIAAAVFHQDPGGAARAAAIVAGLAMTTLGYVAGRIAASPTTRGRTLAAESEMMEPSSPGAAAPGWG